MKGFCGNEIELSPRKQTLGAPHLAGFSRDVGYHSPPVVILTLSTP